MSYIGSFPQRLPDPKPFRPSTTCYYRTSAGLSCEAFFRTIIPSTAPERQSPSGAKVMPRSSQRSLVTSMHCAQLTERSVPVDSFCTGSQTQNLTNICTFSLHVHHHPRILAINALRFRRRLILKWMIGPNHLYLLRLPAEVCKTLHTPSESLHTGQNRRAFGHEISRVFALSKRHHTNPLPHRAQWLPRVSVVVTYVKSVDGISVQPGAYC